MSERALELLQRGNGGVHAGWRRVVRRERTASAMTALCCGSRRSPMKRCGQLAVGLFSHEFVSGVTLQK